MLDLGATINVMPTSIYKSLNCGDLEPTGMTIQLANRSFVQPLGVLEDILVQVDELIFPVDFYVLEMEDETPRKGSTLILGRPFLMTARTKIDVHAGTLTMEFGDTLVQFNIFEAMKHLVEDTSLFSINLIDELVKEYMQVDTSNTESFQVVGNTDKLDCLGSIFEEPDHDEPWGVHDAKVTTTLAHLEHDSKSIDPFDQVHKNEKPECEVSPPKPPTELKPLPNHLKYAYLGDEQQFPQPSPGTGGEIVTSPQQHKKAIGWKLSDLPGINPSICTYKILMEEEARPVRQQQRRLNPTILDVVNKEVTKLLTIGIIYPILDNNWVSLVLVVPKKSGMTVMKNQNDELVPTRVRTVGELSLGEAGREVPLLLPRRIFWIHTDTHCTENQHKTTFTCPFDTFVYTRMLFRLCNAPSTF
ncbi:hypothetical protein CR513_38280, partial [Mucuna pruriens]